MQQAFIYDAVRTPIGRYGGALAQVRTDDLGAVPLRAAGRAGLELPYSCRAGVCSTCRARLVKGKITMEHNMALEEWEVKAGYFLCCQARPESEQIEITYDE
jgi:ring-1,2-phenylacetyl-CoA epoxidase subunit PaaE